MEAPTVDSTLPIHKEDKKRVDVPPVAADGQTDHSTQLSCQEDGNPEDVPTDGNDMQHTSSQL